MNGQQIKTKWYGGNSGFIGYVLSWTKIGNLLSSGALKV